ncbi:peptidase [Streptomyces sp. VRA16 Mangrove soil]|uniref:peptidase n=1 Tax=Streptomyces sp. VRA16 Mangrove soil TaxID=2817434 RepID=UPI001A9D346F|nr:peptidase [Streptomyces sp. VRA16 Mangrove soil]MBO1331299.1 peptidase [Streptomyces sp. VRA16 Mangrove soil]
MSSSCARCPYPSHTQFASPDLVGPIVNDGFDRAADPAWRESGARTVADYARWCGHLCGATCLRMALGPDAPSLFELRDGAVKFGAYTVDAEGEIRGMVYAPAVEYVREVHGVDASVHRELTVAGIGELLDAGRLVIASVHYAIRRPHDPAPGRGGHLVLVTGRTADGAGLHFHNPSGTDAASRTADLPAARFAEFFAGRGMSLAVPAEAATGTP